MNYQIFVYPTFADPTDAFFHTDIGIFTSMERAIEVFMKYADTAGVELALTRLTDKQLGNKRATDPSDEEIDHIFQDFILRYDIKVKDWSCKEYRIWCDYYDYQEDRQLELDSELIAEFYHGPQNALDYFRKCENDRYITAARLIGHEIFDTSTDDDSDDSEEIVSYDDDLGELMEKADPTNESNSTDK